MREVERYEPGDPRFQDQLHGQDAPRRERSRSRRASIVAPFTRRAGSAAAAAVSASATSETL